MAFVKRLTIWRKLVGKMASLQFNVDFTKSGGILKGFIKANRTKYNNPFNRLILLMSNKKRENVHGLLTL